MYFPFSKMVTPLNLALSPEPNIGNVFGVFAHCTVPHNISLKDITPIYSHIISNTAFQYVISFIASYSTHLYIKNDTHSSAHFSY